MTISAQEAGTYIGRTLYSTTNGDKIGKIGQVYLDDQSGEPEWVTVSTGLFGTKETFVPIANATVQDDGLAVPLTKEQVKEAPNVDLEGGHLSPEEEATLYRFYNMEYAEPGRYTDTDVDSSYSQTDTYSDTSQVRSETMRASGRHAVDGDIERGEGAMTRSEERLNVGTERVATGKARLRKWVETEVQTIQVPVRKEKVRLESEPITDGNAGDAFDGPDFAETQHEVTLTEERPVVTTEAVPVERVRLETDVVQETRTVEGEVRKERIALDADEDIHRS